MTTINAVGTNLSGQTGTGSFVGSASPTFTGTPVLPANVNFNGTTITAPPITKIKVTTFGAGTNTFTPQAGNVFTNARIVGPGGGSGGSTGAAGQSASNGGAGGGGYCEKTYTAALLGASATVVVGTGGLAGTAGNNAGGDGSAASTFTPAGAGAVLSAGPGTGSAGQTSIASTNNTSGGTGGAATGGDINIPGGNGTAGVVVSGVGNTYVPGIGGSSGLGTPSFNNAVSGSATASSTYGAGAAGRNNITGGSQAGIPGSDGFCIITEYISA